MGTNCIKFSFKKDLGKYYSGNKGVDLRRKLLGNIIDVRSPDCFKLALDILCVYK